jgi:hypothetical protein
MSNDTQRQVEPSSWWPLVAIVFGALGAYALLAVHLVIEAAGERTSMWTWMAVPGGLFLAAALTLAVGSGIPVRERFATIPAALLGYSPRVPMLTQRSSAAGTAEERSANRVRR